MHTVTMTLTAETIEALRARLHELAEAGDDSEDAADAFVTSLATQFTQVPYALAINVLVPEAADPQGGRRAWVAFHALKLLLRRIAIHFEDVADGLGLAQTEAPLVEVAKQAREGSRAAVDVLAFVTLHTMAPGHGA